ncbi:MAG: DNA replication/repair protein RecF [Pseudomonadota bacterium]
MAAKSGAQLEIEPLQDDARPTSQDLDVASAGHPKCAIRKVLLNNFRNYDHISFDVESVPVILTGSNGAGKTNLLEAISLLAPGNGLRRTPFAELSKFSTQSGWTVSAQVETQVGTVRLGTGLNPSANAGAKERSGRIVRVDGETTSAGALTQYLHVNWLTPAMDGLFTGPASERRRFLDRLITSLDPNYRKSLNQFDRAMRQRNKLLETPNASVFLFEGLEVQMAEIGVSISAARREAITRLSATIEMRRKELETQPCEMTFPWATLALQGTLEEWLMCNPAVDVEDLYIQALAQGRDLDRAAKRTLTGPHRSDFIVYHGPKDMPAQYCSTGEQKALLAGLILAHTQITKQLNAGHPPILLFDEIAAHFDQHRRCGLFKEILQLGVQAWMTGTDKSMFSDIESKAQFFTVDNGQIAP